MVNEEQSALHCSTHLLRWLHRVLYPGVRSSYDTAGSLKNRATLAGFKAQTNMSFLFYKHSNFNKCVTNIISQGLERILKPKSIVWRGLSKEKVENNFSSSHNIAVYCQYPQSSHRYISPHIFAVFGVVYSSTSEDNKNSSDEENILPTDDSGTITTPTQNHHKKRDSNGRFAKAKVKSKVNDPMRRSLAARRRLVFDECDKNEPPTKRQTRSDEVQFTLHTLLSNFMNK